MGCKRGCEVASGGLGCPAAARRVPQYVPRGTPTSGWKVASAHAHTHTLPTWHDHRGCFDPPARPCRVSQARGGEAREGRGGCTRRIAPTPNTAPPSDPARAVAHARKHRTGPHLQSCGSSLLQQVLKGEEHASTWLQRKGDIDTFQSGGAFAPARRHGGRSRRWRGGLCGGGGGRAVGRGV